MNKSEVIIEEIIEERKIKEEYIDAVVNYLTVDNYIRDRLKTSLKRGSILDEFTWNMLNGNGKVYVDYSVYGDFCCILLAFLFYLIPYVVTQK